MFSFKEKKKTVFDLKNNPKRKFPSLSQWKRFFNILSKKEKIYFFVFFVLFFVSFIFLSVNFYYKHTEIVPATAGELREGVIEQPRFINPIYAGSDVERDLVELLFSGLMKYNGNMEIVPDLVQNYEISEDGKVYKFYLKKNILWHDKKPLTADDVVFTIKTIQNPDVKSVLRPEWIGVEVEKIDDFSVKFTLPNRYASFLENCTVKIIPKHIWENVLPKNMILETQHNLLNPIGSGPYKVKKINQTKNGKTESIVLEQNPLYYDKKPYLETIKFIFFENKDKLIKSAKENKIDAFSSALDVRLDSGWKKYSISFPRYFALFFNPEKSELFKSKNVRLAINYAIDKKALVKEVLGIKDEKQLEKAIVDSPILPKIYGFNKPNLVYEYNVEKAKELLKEAGFQKNEKGFFEKRIKKEPSFLFKKRLEVGSKGKEVRELQKCLSKIPGIPLSENEITGYFGKKTKEAVIKFQEKYAKEILEPWGFKKGTGIVSKTTIKKLNEICFPREEKVIPLKFSITTAEEEQLEKIAENLKKQLEQVGIKVEIKKFPLSQLTQDFIKPRNYEALLLGEVLKAIPDPLPFWESSQKKDPGLNFSLFSDKKADKLLKEIRKSLDEKTRKEKLELFQDIVVEKAPAVFLYSPDYIYYVSKKIKGIRPSEDGREKLPSGNLLKITQPSKRFSEINKWYIKTKRKWKF